MELEHLRIVKNPSYNVRPNDYTGSIKYVGQHGEVEIALDHQLSTEVLKLCAASLTRATRDIAQNMTAAVLEQAGSPALEDKS